MNKSKFNLALEYLKKYKKSLNKKDKQFYHSQYINELFRTDQLYIDNQIQIKKNVGIN